MEAIRYTAVVTATAASAFCAATALSMFAAGTTPQAAVFWGIVAVPVAVLVSLFAED